MAAVCPEGVSPIASCTRHTRRHRVLTPCSTVYGEVLRGASADRLLPGDKSAEPPHGELRRRGMPDLLSWYSVKAVMMRYPQATWAQVIVQISLDGRLDFNQEFRKPDGRTRIGTVTVGSDLFGETIRDRCAANHYLDLLSQPLLLQVLDCSTH